MDLNKQLKERLHDKIQQQKNSRYQIKLKDQRKINKQVDMEKKQMDTDSRVTPVMKKWFMDAMSASPDYDVKNPVYILDNLETEKLKFYNFLAKYLTNVKTDMDEWKQTMMVGYNKLDNSFEKEEYMKSLEAEYKKKFNSYFTTPYIVYYSLMTDINVFEDLLKL